MSQAVNALDEYPELMKFHIKQASANTKLSVELLLGTDVPAPPPVVHRLLLLPL